MSSSHWEEFYANHLPPADFEDNRTLLKEFCDRHNEDQTSIVLVTVCKIFHEIMFNFLLYVCSHHSFWYCIENHDAHFQVIGVVGYSLFFFFSFFCILFFSWVDPLVVTWMVSIWKPNKTCSTEKIPFRPSARVYSSFIFYPSLHVNNILTTKGNVIGNYC